MLNCELKFLSSQYHFSLESLGALTWKVTGEIGPWCIHYNRLWYDLSMCAHFFDSASIANRSSTYRRCHQMIRLFATTASTSSRPCSKSSHRLGRVVALFIKNVLLYVVFVVRIQSARYVVGSWILLADTAYCAHVVCSIRLGTHIKSEICGRLSWIGYQYISVKIRSQEIPGSNKNLADYLSDHLPHLCFKFFVPKRCCLVI